MSKLLEILRRRAVLVIAASLFFPSFHACAPAAVHGPSPIPAADAETREYRIQPGDQMDVKFFYNPELNESATVRPDGRNLSVMPEVLNRASGLGF
jgi:polysaccharide biosynthesis/export protein PslD